MSVNEEIQSLLDLQAKDLEHAELEAQVKRLEASAARTRRDMGEEQAAVAALRDRLKDLERSSRLKNLEVDELHVHTRDYQKRLDEGIISFKEMEALRVKIQTERHHMSALEDEALASMETIETTRTELARREQALVERTRALTDEGMRIDAQVAQTRQEIAACLAERARIAVQTRAHLLARYDNLRREFPNPVVLISNGSCSGCKLRVSGNTVERARHASDVVTCENCSRILYVG
jgi:hypothetical protein